MHHRIAQMMSTIFGIIGSWSRTFSTCCLTSLCIWNDHHKTFFETQARITTQKIHCNNYDAFTVYRNLIACLTSLHYQLRITRTLFLESCIIVQVKLITANISHFPCTISSTNNFVFSVLFFFITCWLLQVVTTCIHANK